MILGVIVVWKTTNYMFFLIMVITFICVFTVFTFLPLRFANWNPGIKSEWIGFAGAIIGGIIAGGMTLEGVRLTLLENEKNSFLDSYYKKEIKLSEIDGQLSDIHHNAQQGLLSNISQVHHDLRTHLQTIEKCIKEIKVSIGGRLALKVHREYDSFNFNFNNNDTKDAVESLGRITSEIGSYREELEKKYDSIKWKY
jgi:hypothetical protein